MISKEALIFINRIKSFDEDLELIDVFRIALYKKDLLKEHRKLFKYIKNSNHVNLVRRRPTDKSRKIVLNHLRNTVYSSYIKDLYEELTGYLKSLLTVAAKMSKDKAKASRLIGEHSISIKATDVLRYNSLDDLVSFIAESIIQALENERSTMDLIKKVCNKIDLQVDDSIIKDAMPYLEVRHKLVHTNGVVDDSFKTRFPAIQIDGDNSVILNYKLVSSARSAVTKLVQAIDEKAVEKAILSPNTATV